MNRFLAAAALLTAATIAQGAVTVTCNITLGIISFSPGSAVYICSPAVTATGFTDDSNTDNYVRILANNSHFGGDYYPARHTGSGQYGSQGFSSAAALAADINSATAWTLTLTDGVTHATRTYSLSVTSSGIAAGYMRPVTLDVAPGTPISENPVFHFTQPTTSLPNSQNNSAFAFMIGNTPGNYPPGPPIQPNDTQWGPTGPLSPDTYVVVISKSNETPPQTLVNMTNPAPQAGAPALAAFNKTIRVQSDGQSDNLTVQGAPPTPSYDVFVSLAPNCLSFSPLDPFVYILGVGLDCTGFVDDDNLNNFIKLQSRDHSFTGDYYPARFTGSGTAGSAGFTSPATLSAAINNENPWTMTITDGQTGRTQTLTMNITTSGIAADYLRPITLAVHPGDSISSTPTFTFTQPSTSIPAAQNTDGFNGLFGDNNHSYFTPQITAAATSWTPDGPIAPDDYLVLIAKVVGNPPQNLIQTTTPVPGANSAALLSLTKRITCQSSAQTGPLHALPGTCTADFNNDGDVGTDQDIEAFFRCLAGTCCTLCGSADFNGDGDVGTDQDIESFFRVLAGGNC